MAIDPQAQPVPVDVDPFVPPPIAHLSAVAYLVGHPIAHSSSPALHDSISSTTAIPYAQLLVESKDLESFMAYLRQHPSTPRLLGSGVTMPHKVAVIPYLDHLTPEAQAIGAVNTIFFKPRQPSSSSTTTTPSHQQLEFWGTNTDTLGIRDAFRSNLSPATLSRSRGLPGLVVGGGGTCRAAIYALQHFLGCSDIYIINRDAGEVDAVLAEYRARVAPPTSTSTTSDPSASTSSAIESREGALIHVSSLSQAQSLPPPSLIVSAIPDFTPQTTGEKDVRDILTWFLNQNSPQTQTQTQTQPHRGALLEMCYHPSPDTQITQLATSLHWQVIGGIEAMIGQGVAQAKLWTAPFGDQESTSSGNGKTETWDEDVVRREARTAVVSGRSKT